MTAARSSELSIQQQMLRRRLPVVVVVIVTVSIAMVVRMIAFQAPQDPRVAAYLQSVRDANYGQVTQRTSPRGLIYDRSGQPLAVNTLQYRIGISPNLISVPETAIQDLSVILGLDPLAVREIVTSDAPYVLLDADAAPDVWRQIDAIETNRIALRAEQIPRRYYPQGSLAGPVIGFVAGGAEDLRGYNGVEGFYQELLTGQTRSEEVSALPFDLPEAEGLLERGADLVLTLDRDVQFLIEEELAQAVISTGAIGGTVIVMNPRTGDILGMASYPTFDPNNIPLNDENLLGNPAIRDAYEPGSVFKVITAAAALDEGVITPDWTYNDDGVYQVGDEIINNWDDQAYGVVDVTSLLVESLNVGAATLAVDELGRETFYRRIRAFGIGERTRVDMEGEQAGILRLPGDEFWSESDLATNSFGQGLATTPLQMLNAVNAIANGGLLMQPRMVSQVVRGTQVTNLDTVVVRRVISPDTARIVTDMMVQVVETGLDDAAALPGYSIAGKTGTAQIFTPVGPMPNRFNMTFIGFLPADDPQISVLVLLREPTSGQFASQTAAPVFRRLVERLVLKLEIPSDAQRQQIAAAGGVVGQIKR